MRTLFLHRRQGRRRTKGEPRSVTGDRFRCPCGTDDRDFTNWTKLLLLYNMRPDIAATEFDFVIRIFPI
jgi:hypothetical protein